jgi:peroxiredoxin
MNLNNALMKDIKALLLMLTTTVSLFLVFYFPNKLMEKELAYRQLFDITTGLQLKEDALSFSFEQNNRMTGLKAPDVRFTESKWDTTEHALSELVSHTALLVYRYADINCKACFDVDIQALQAEFADTPALTGILCSYMYEQDFSVFKRLNKIKLSFYRVASDAFDWPVEESGKPYYFILHPDMKISHVYVPDKEFPELNRQYLEGVKRFLLE